MRLKEDQDSWRASAIKRRDFRHTKGDPEISHHTKKARAKVRKPKNRHKHIWVEVGHREWTAYHDHRWYRYYDSYDVPNWAEFRTFFVCCDCLQTMTKEDKGAWRKHYRRR